MARSSTHRAGGKRRAKHGIEERLRLAAQLLDPRLEDVRQRDDAVAEPMAG